MSDALDEYRPPVGQRDLPIRMPEAASALKELDQRIEEARRRIAELEKARNVSRTVLDLEVNI